MIKNLLQNTTQLAQAIWAHYLSPQLASGAYAAVDATCGRGHDTVWLVARCGRVYAFDIQRTRSPAPARRCKRQASLMHRFSRKRRHHSLLQTFKMCRHYHKYRQMAGCTRHLIGQRRLQCFLLLPSLLDSHANLARYVSEPIGLIVFNLGYLPGGDKERATQAETTLASLQAALDKLTVGGLLSVTMYWGHEAGKTERAAVTHWAARSTAAPITACIRICAISQTPAGDSFRYRKKSAGVSFRTG